MRNRFASTLLVGFLSVLFTFAAESALPQGVKISLEYPPRVFAPVPSITGWSGFSIARDDYAWLDRRGVQFRQASEVDSTTLMLKFTSGFSYQGSLGLEEFQSPMYVDPQEFYKYRADAKVNEYWQRSVSTSIQRDQKDKAPGLINIQIPVRLPGAVQSIIGEGGVGLRVNGYYRVSFDGQSQWDDRTQVATYKQSKFPSLNMEQVSSFKITGNIGSKIEVRVDQDSKRQTDLDNRIQIRYQGTEDEIIQTIEAGNTNLSLPNTQFVGYSQNVQGLFGIKATAQLGNLGMTFITSQEKGSTENSNFTAGAQQSSMIRRDHEYLKNTFFDLGLFGTPQDVAAGRAHFVPGRDSLVDFKLFEQETDLVRFAPRPGIAAVFADSATSENLGGDNREILETTWVEVDRSEYLVFDKGLYIEMLTRPTDTDQLACWMKVWNGTDTVEVGDALIEEDVADSLLHLQLLKINNAQSDYSTWGYEWRNVYYLGARFIEPDGIELKIFKGQKGTEDKQDENFDTQSGVPYIQILGLDRLDQSGNANPDGRIDITDDRIFLDKGYLFFPDRRPFDNPELDERVPEIYDNSSFRDVQDASKYYLAIDLKQRQTEFSLGKINIIEGSEVVTLNGRTLTKGQDYTIYYDIGRIIFRTDDVLDPNAQVEVDFEYEPFIAAEKKSLFGSRLEYVLSKNFNIGTTVLYKSEKSTDRKPKVGQEESKYLVWDSDFSTSFELPLLTELADALPFVEASSMSRVSFSGEVAQSVPNPNTLGEAFIDDFEGAREAYSLSELRHYWTRSSAPLTGSEHFTDLTTNPLGRIIWYNPWQETPITDIWNRDVRDRDNRTHTLVLRITPNTSTGNPEDSWAGLMRPISRGAWDQSRTQFLEVRMKRPATNGKMLIHLGKISEDINGNSKLDTEDFVYKNDILDEGEDVGLDGLTDEEEREAIPEDQWYSESDPAGDNWFYDNDDPDNYEQINGRQGNAEDPGRGYYPDTEDIDGDKQIDLVNSYFEYVLDFTDDKYLVPNSEYNNWVTYRFPLDEPDNELGGPSLKAIEFARLILTDFPQQDSVQIASMELVSTRWLVQRAEEEDIADDDSTKLEVAVINTEENSSIYQPPPGVVGFYDRVNDITEKEQSLWLKYKELLPGDIALAERILFTGENYAGYRRVEMYVHSTEEDSNTYFIFRMGSDSTNYYEYRTRLYRSSPTVLWDERNWVRIDLDAITQVKDSLNTLKVENPDSNIDMLAVGNYAVRGQPRVTNIIYFGVGVWRPETAPDSMVTGELWLDELRVTDVRKDKGIAKRLSTTATLSDLGSFSLSYRNTDAFFRQLTAADRNNLGSGREQTSLSISGSFNFDKFLPRQWGARLPISYSWSKSEVVPRLKSGSDIVITEDQREAETTRNYSQSLTVSQRFNRKTNNWLWNYTLNSFEWRFSASRTSGKSPTVPVTESENYTATAKYDLNVGKKSLRIFSWTSFIPFFPDAITNTEFGYFPNSMSFSGDIRRRSSKSENIQGYKQSVYERDFSGSAMIRYQLFGSLPLSYTFTTQRDLRDPELLQFSFNPKKFKLGLELSRRQSVSASYDPRIFDFMTTQISFKSNYDENSDPGRNQEGTRTASSKSTWAFNSQFDPKKFFGTGKGKGKDFIVLRPFLFAIRLVTNRIDPLKFSYSKSDDYATSGLLDRPTYAFQFGLTKDPGVDSREVEGSARRFNDSQTKSYSAQSAVDFILGSRISTRYTERVSTSITRKQESRSTTFPDLSVTFSRLERFKILGWLFKSLSVNSGYSHKLDESINTNSGEKSKEIVTDAFSPLANVSITWPKGVKTELRYETSTNTTKSFTGAAREQINESRTVSMSNSYNFRSPTGVKIPLLGRLKFQSTLSLSLNIMKRFSSSKQVDSRGVETPGNESEDLTISPQASYSFSSNIKGGLSMRWTDRVDKRTRSKSHVRKVGIWVEIRF